MWHSEITPSVALASMWLKSGEDASRLFSTVMFLSCASGSVLDGEHYSPAFQNFDSKPRCLVQ